MQHSSTATLWAIPSQIRKLEKKPAQSVQVVLTSAYSGSPIPDISISGGARAPHNQDFVVAKTRQMGYFVDSPLGLTAEQQRVRTMLTAAELQELPFEKAAEHWIELKKLHREPKTVKSYRDYVQRLTGAFAGLVLKDIHIGHFEEYQRRNRADYHPTAVNHDLNALSQILRKANLWKPVEEHYHPLKVPKWQPPKVLTEEQEDAFFKLAASNPEWDLAYWVSSLTNNTSAHGIELRKLQVKHVVLDGEEPIFYVPDGKNVYRPRSIPLNETGVKQLRRILDRAGSLGASQADHYIFPFRVKRNFFDPTRPASESWLRKKWKKLVDAATEINPVTEKAIIPFRIKPSYLRHQIITKLMEAGTPEQTTMSIVGHVRREMLDHYSHTRIAAKKAALSAISPKKRGASA